MDDKLQTETIEIKPVRLFHCKNHKNPGYSLTRSQVKKGIDGNYRCNSCGGVVEDVTATTTGREILRWLSTGTY